jgi:uncharacterized protein (TIGR02594 family)
MSTEAPWLDDALSRLGQKEVPGKAKNNPKIMECFVDCGHDIEREGLTDETAWCAAGAGSCLVRAGYPIPPTDTNLMARSYCSYGVKCEPKRGAIGVWARGKYPFGHVGFITKVYANGNCDLAAGNMGNQWKIAKGEYNVKKALAIRWPVAPTPKALKAAGSTEIKEADLLQKAAVAAPVLGTVGTIAEKTVNAAPPVPEPGVLDQLKTLAEPVGVIQTVTEGTVAMGNLLMANLWLIGVIGLSGVVWYIAAKRKKKRLEKHAAGVPLSQEVVFNA